MCVWTVPQDIVIALQSSSTCLEGWWDQETSAKVKGVNVVFKKILFACSETGGGEECEQVTQISTFPERRHLLKNVYIAFVYM